MRSYSLTTQHQPLGPTHQLHTSGAVPLLKKGHFHRNDPTLSLKSQAFLVKSFALFLIEQTLKGTEKNPQALRNREKMGLIWPISLPKNFTEQMEPIRQIWNLGSCPEFWIHNLDPISGWNTPPSCLTWHVYLIYLMTFIKSLLCIEIVMCFANINSFPSHNNAKKIKFLLSPFYRQGAWNSSVTCCRSLARARI